MVNILKRDPNKPIHFRVIDFSGARLGMLKIIDLVGKSQSTHHSCWSCVCDCGNECFIFSTEITKSSHTSCGCLGETSKLSDRKVEFVDSIIEVQKNPNKRKEKKRYEFTDLSNKKFIKLTVIGKVGEDNSGEPLWDCLCDCGNLITCSHKSLSNFNITHCGCFEYKNEIPEKAKNLTDMRFGKLTVKKYMGTDLLKQSYAKEVVWMCICDCGNERAASSISLLKGNCRSCGCLKYENFNKMAATKRTRSPLGDKIKTYAARAKKKGINFSLTRNQMHNLFKMNCFYCGIEPSQVCKLNWIDKEVVYIYNGIDRIDSSKGYEMGNVVTCCKHCNSAKLEKSFDEFVEYINRIKSHNIGDISEFTSMNSKDLDFSNKGTDDD